MGVCAAGVFHVLRGTRRRQRHPMDSRRSMNAQEQCAAKSKRSGERCRRPPVPGKRVCYYHGGASTGPKTSEGRQRCSLAATVHGAYVERVLDAEEQAIYDGFLAQMRQDFTLNTSSDEVAVLMAAMSFVQYCRAQKAGKEDAAETQARIIRNNLKDLKATKIAREGEAVSLQTTPAEWATALLEEIRGRRGKPRRAAKTPETGKTQKESQI